MPITMKSAADVDLTQFQDPFIHMTMEPTTTEKKRGLLGQFWLYFFCLIIIPLLISGGVISWQLFEVALNDALALQRSHAQLAQAKIAEQFDRLQSELRDLTTQRRLERLTTEEQRATLIQLLFQYRQLTKVALLDARGRDLISLALPTADPPEATSYAEDNTFAEVLETRLKKTSPIQFFGEPLTPYVLMFFPILDAQTSQVSRILVATIGFHEAQQIISEVQFGERGYAYLVDSLARLIAHPASNPVAIGSPISVAVKDGQQMGLNGEAALLAVADVRLDQNILYVVTEMPVAEAYQFATRILWIIGGLIIFALISATIFSFNLTGRIIRPLQKLYQTADAVQHGDLSRRVEISGSEQMEILGKAFNAMVARLGEMLQAHKDRTEELENLNKELERFAYITSHDLQEPLRKIQAFGERLEKQSAGALDEKALHYLERMRDSANRMRNLINDLLVYSRVSTRDEERVTVDLNIIVQNVLSDLEVQMERTSGRVDAGRLPSIEANPTLMHLLFQNLISNGLKFHREGVPPVVTISSQRRPRKPASPMIHEIRVQDNGIGFEDSERDRMFEVFQRLHGRFEFEGTGIGLAICKKVVERHGGEITAQGRPGEGAIFTVSLPEKRLSINGN